MRIDESHTAAKIQIPGKICLNLGTGERFTYQVRSRKLDSQVTRWLPPGCPCLKIRFGSFCPGTETSKQTLKAKFGELRSSTLSKIALGSRIAMTKPQK